VNLITLTKKIRLVSDKYATKFGINRDKVWYLLKLQEEMGELTQAYLSYTGRARHKNKTVDELKQAFEMEIADVLCHILLLIDSEKVNVKKAVKEKWLKRLLKTKVSH